MRYQRAENPGYTPLADTTRWEWTDAAGCRGKDIDLFYGADNEHQPEREIREAKAKAICRQCPVMVPCREIAIKPAPAYQYGVQGGMTAEERIDQRRQQIRRKDVGLSDRTRANPIDAVGLSRRLQALAAHGHGTARISAETGISRAALSDSRLHRVVRPFQRTVDMIREVYPRLLAMPPTPGSPAVALAARMGWLRADAWTADTIDDPNALPRVHEPAA